MNNHIPVLLLSAGILFAAAAVLYYVLAGLSVARKELKTDEAKRLLRTASVRRQARTAVRRHAVKVETLPGLVLDVSEFKPEADLLREQRWPKVEMELELTETQKQTLRSCLSETEGEEPGLLLLAEGGTP